MERFLLIALFSIVPISLLVAFVRRSSVGGDRKRRMEAWTNAGYFVIIALVCYQYYLSLSPASFGDESSVTYHYKEYVYNYDNGSLKEPSLVSELAEYAYVGLTAFLPALVYLFFIISCDDKKPEPLHFLLLAVLVGAATAFVSEFMGFSLYDYGLSLKQKYSLAESINLGFLKIALPSEVFKWLVLLIFLKLNKYYDEYVDGAVYSVCLSMGFACVLYVGYMLHFIGAPFWTFVLLGLVIAMISIPINMIAGEVMGYYIALTKHRNRFLNLLLSLILPWFVSGVMYSALAFIGDKWWYYLLFAIVLTLLSAAVFYQIDHLMALDTKNSKNGHE